MGSASSSSTPVGVPANPRLVYNEKLSKQDKKNYKLDTPVLVDVEHGSVRYRYAKYDGEPSNKARRIEKPFQGEQRVEKQNYFYHARLNDFSEKSSCETEEDYKFRIVTQGPARAKQKKLFYVYSIGWNKNSDGKRVMPTMSKEEGNDYAWPQIRKPNEMYYDLRFDNKGGDLTEEITPEDRLQQNLSSTANKNDIELILSDEESIQDVKKNLAVKILKSASDIHVCQGKRELRNEDIVGDLRSEGEGEWKTFRVHLVLI